MIRLIIEEILDEMATIYKSKENRIMIAVNPDSGRIGCPYFKYLNDSNYLKAEKIVRILFKEADYVVHNDGKDLWELNNREKKLLMDVLQEQSKKYPKYTNWQAAKFDWNCEYLEEMLQIDDYFNGNYDDIYASDSGYVPSDLEMPNYLMIEFRR